MQIGDKYRFTPEAFGAERSGTLPGKRPLPREVTGTVVYIHPQRRFFTVAVEIHGHIIRESFTFKG